MPRIHFELNTTYALNSLTLDIAKIRTAVKNGVYGDDINATDAKYTEPLNPKSGSNTIVGSWQLRPTHVSYEPDATFAYHLLTGLFKIEGVTAIEIGDIEDVTRCNNVPDALNTIGQLNLERLTLLGTDDNLLGFVELMWCNDGGEIINNYTDTVEIDRVINDATTAAWPDWNAM